MIKVLIAEDSVTQREILARVVREDDEMTIVGQARNGVEGVEQVRELSPDVVLMDVHMDEMNGIDATRRIMRENPVPVVIMSSTLQNRDIDLAVEAMRVGAVAVIEKPKGAALLHLAKIAPQLRRTLREAAGTTIKKKGVAEPLAEMTVRPTRYQPPDKPVQVVAIGSSAGGPSVLVQILSALPNPYPIPLLLVQHISTGFEEGFANWLSGQTRQSANIVTGRQRLMPGTWLGPTGHHLVMESRHQIGLRPRRPDDIHCPAANPLLASVAERCGDSAVGIVLTGMGDDGAQGLLALKQAGGQTIIQDEATAMVWGMPQAAKKVGAAQYEMNPAEIADALCRIAEK